MGAVSRSGPPIGVTAAWLIEHRNGPAELLHATTPPAQVAPTAWILEVDEPTIVLGSSQQVADIDSHRVVAAGLALVARRSGGGAVLLVPGEHVWIDVWVPATSRWWHEDVVRATDWLGDVWVAALGRVGLDELEVHRGGLISSRWSRQVCFAGLGPGEVTAGGAKLVGISQRRTRDWARFQCVVHRRWDAEALFAVLADPTARAAGRDLHVAEIAGRDIVSAFVDALSLA